MLTSMTKLFIGLLCFLSFLASSFAVIGIKGCKDNRDGCLDCAKNYTLSTTHVAIPEGCHKSSGKKNGNALPFDTLMRFDRGKDKINRKIWEIAGDGSQIISELCGRYALQMGFDYFGIEFYSECYFGVKEDIKGQGLVKAKDCAKKCKYDVGVGNYMMIFKIEKVN